MWWELTLPILCLKIVKKDINVLEDQQLQCQLMEHLERFVPQGNIVQKEQQLKLIVQEDRMNQDKELLLLHAKSVQLVSTVLLDQLSQSIVQLRIIAQLIVLQLLCVLMELIMMISSIWKPQINVKNA